MRGMAPCSDSSSRSGLSPWTVASWTAGPVMGIDGEASVPSAAIEASPAGISGPAVMVAIPGAAAELAVRLSTSGLVL